MPKVHRCLEHVGSARQLQILMQDNVPYFVPGTSKFKFRDGSQEGNLKDVCLSAWPLRLTNPVYVILIVSIQILRNRESSIYYDSRWIFLRLFSKIDFQKLKEIN